MRTHNGIVRRGLKGLSSAFRRRKSGTLQKIMQVALVQASLLILHVPASGQADDLFKARCSSCHGMDGSGSTPAGKKLGAADLRSQQVQRLDDDELFKTIAYGVGHKNYAHAFVRRGLTQKQVADLIPYIRKLSKK